MIWGLAVSHRENCFNLSFFVHVQMLLMSTSLPLTYLRGHITLFYSSFIQHHVDQLIIYQEPLAKYPSKCAPQHITISFLGGIQSDKRKVKLQNICASSWPYYNVILTFHAIRMKIVPIKRLEPMWCSY